MSAAPRPPKATDTNKEDAVASSSTLQTESKVGTVLPSELDEKKATYAKAFGEADNQTVDPFKEGVSGVLDQGEFRGTSPEYQHFNSPARTPETQPTAPDPWHPDPIKSDTSDGSYPAPVDDPLGENVKTDGADVPATVVE